MGKHVLLEVTSSCAEVVTLCATEISFSCMGYHVFFEGTSLCAGVVTLRANKKAFLQYEPARVFSDDQL